MKKNYIKRIALLIIALVLVAVFVSCDNGNTNNLDNDNSIEESYIVYNTEQSLSLNGAEITYKWSDYRYNSSTANINSISSFSVTVTSKNIEKTEYEFSNIYAIRESNEAKYEVSTNYIGTTSFSLECDMSKTVSFSCDLPSNLKEDKYYLIFTINENQYKVYMYEMPDNLRKEYKVTYYVNNQIIKTSTVLENKSFPSITYLNDSQTEYCNSWYTDNTYKTSITGQTKITGDIAVYGRSLNVYKWNVVPNENSSYFQGMNIAIDSNELYIPAKYQGYSVKIDNFAISSNLIGITKLHIGKVGKIYFQYWKNTSITDIYYEGTESDWADYEILSTSWNSSIVMHYNSK